ncbi:MAG: hypothetical protein DHS80DRAFT_25840 [Piptocephalis tieghemiana]|nr:MAG: hypothetical protein DHS80DRAFT_25840 [Piptocephalis tieghemiana]
MTSFANFPGTSAQLPPLLLKKPSLLFLSYPRIYHFSHIRQLFLSPLLTHRPRKLLLGPKSSSSSFPAGPIPIPNDSLPSPTTASVPKITTTLSQRLRSPSTVTTMEAKYTMHSHVAEFWCTITSCFIALPLLLYAWYPISLIPPSVHASIIGSVISAIASTIYHTTNQKIWSAMDVSLACTMIHFSTLSLLQVTDVSLWALSTLLLLAYLLKDWENTAKPAIHAMILIVPVKVGVLSLLATPTSLFAMICGVVGIGCFLADRKGLFCGHIFWHVLAGLCLLASSWNITHLTLTR